METHDDRIWIAVVLIASGLILALRIWTLTTRKKTKSQGRGCFRQGMVDNMYAAVPYKLEPRISIKPLPLPLSLTLEPEMISIKLREKMEAVGINQQGRDGIVRIENIVQGGHNLNFSDSQVALKTILYLVESLVMPQTLATDSLSKMVERARKEGFDVGKIAGFKKGKNATRDKAAKAKKAAKPKKGKKDEATIEEQPNNPPKNDAASPDQPSPAGTTEQDGESSDSGTVGSGEAGDSGVLQQGDGS